MSSRRLPDAKMNHEKSCNCCFIFFSVYCWQISVCFPWTAGIERVKRKARGYETTQNVSVKHRAQGSKATKIYERKAWKSEATELPSRAGLVCKASLYHHNKSFLSVFLQGPLFRPNGDETWPIETPQDLRSNTGQVALTIRECCFCFCFLFFFFISMRFRHF